MSKKLVVEQPAVQAVSVGDLDTLLVEIAGKTAELAAIPGAEALKEVQKEYHKQFALETLEALKTRRITEERLAGMDKTHRLEKLIQERNTLRKLGESGKYVGGVFIKALPSTHPVMIRKQEIDAIISDGVRDANVAIDAAIQQQIAFIKAQGYEIPAPNRKQAK